MKTLLIAVSLAANVALVVLLARPKPAASPARSENKGETTRSADSSGERERPEQPGSIKRSPESSGERKRAEPGSLTLPATLNGTFPKFNDIETIPPADFVAQLSRVGLSQPEVRAALALRFAAELEDRRDDLEAAAKKNPYWMYPSASSELLTELGPAALAELRELARSQAKMLDELAGPEGPSMPPSFADQRRFAGIPADKVAAVKMIEQDYADLAAVVRRDIAVFPFPEDAERLKLVATEREKDIRQLLTPQEFDEYQLRNSPVADRLRNQLVAFEPTEEEFRTIFALVSASPLVGPGGLLQPLGAGRAGAAAGNELKQKLVNALGPQRAAEFEQANDQKVRAAWIEARKK